MASQILLPVLLWGIITTVTPQSAPQAPTTVTPQSDPLYPINGSISSGPGDGSSPPISLQRPFFYFGWEYNQIYVNHNGHMTFTDSWNSFIAQRIPMHGTRDIIAPFWVDLDNTAHGQIYYNQYTSGSILQQATQDINAYFPGLNFSANWVFVATWDEVAYVTSARSRTTFQAVLISGGQYSFVLMNYGTIAATSHNVQAGYDTIDSIDYFSIPGSFSNTATGSNSNFRLSSNVNVPGRWAFQVDLGSRGCTFNGQRLQRGDSFWSNSTCTEKCICTSTGLRCHSEHCSFSQFCQTAEFQFSCQTVRRGICLIHSDPHYHTFDGKSFDFHGTCTYVLSEQCGLERPYYKVEGKNEYRNMNTLVSYIRLVKVYVYNEIIELVKGHLGEVKVNGVFTATPFFLNNGAIHVYQSGFSVVISTAFGLTVSYNINDYVRIGLPYTYQTATCGLCGNFNNLPGDDFRTRQGELVNSAVDFGNSWQALGDDETDCAPRCAGPSCVPCTADQMVLYSSASNCGILQSSPGPFAACHQQLPPQAFVQNCVFDLCALGLNEANLCQALNAYASLCQQNGIVLPSWRSQGFCEIICPANSHFEPQGTGCPATCVNSNSPDICPLPAQESCICNTGHVLSGATCVPGESCGCQHDGFYYNAGDSFWTEDCSQLCECHAGNDLHCIAVSCTPTQECTIRNGQRGCFDPLSTCTVCGDPHFFTLDGAVAHFQGTCSYIITESVSHGPNETQFQVVATNNHRGNNRVSFVSAVDIYLSNLPESVHVRIGPNRRVKVDGSAVSLPTSAGTLAQVVRQGRYIVVNATDLVVHFDGHSTLLVRIGQNRQGRVTGMCGNLNSDPADDKVLPNGTLAQNDNHFGHSWKSSTSQPGCGSTDEIIGDVLGDCRFRAEFSTLCGVITNTSGPFSACHLHSDPQPFFDSCVYDLCLYTPANHMLCSVISAYETTCTLLGLNIPAWRSALLCPESDPCEPLDCAEHEWCGEQDGVYGCFCDEHHHRPNNESYDSSITCDGSSGTMSVSRCQLFEAGFHLAALHLQDHSCTGTLEDGRLVFHYNNDDRLCGTTLTSNGTHFSYENVIQGDVDTHGVLISRQRNIHLHFSCVYPLSQALSMDVGINPVESIVRRTLPVGQGHYHLRMTPYQDSDFLHPLNSNNNIDVEIDQRLYVEIRTEGVDGRQIATIVDSCWATPINDTNHPVRWDLIIAKCPNLEDGTVEIIQNGVSTVAKFSFRMFIFPDHASIYLHCQVHLCLLRDGDCSPHCYPGYHQRNRRDVSYHDTADISLGPLKLSEQSKVRVVRQAIASG